MSFETVFGPVMFRTARTKAARSTLVFLRDNLNLSPVFDWLKRNNVKSVSDFKNVKICEAFDEIEFQYEVKWRVDDKFWHINFYNSKPLIGDFNHAIPQYFKLFGDIMKRPFKKEHEKLKLLNELCTLQYGIEELKNRLREDGVGRQPSNSLYR